MSTKDFVPADYWPLATQVAALLPDHVAAIARHKAQRFGAVALSAAAPAEPTGPESFASEDDRRAYVHLMVAAVCAAEGRPAPPPPLTAPPDMAVAFRAVTPPARRLALDARTLDRVAPRAPTAAALDAALTSHVQVYAALHRVTFGDAVRELERCGDPRYLELRDAHYAAWSQEVSRLTDG